MRTLSKNMMGLLLASAVLTPVAAQAQDARGNNRGDRAERGSGGGGDQQRGQGDRGDRGPGGDRGQREQAAPQAAPAPAPQPQQQPQAVQDRRNWQANPQDVRRGYRPDTGRPDGGRPDAGRPEQRPGNDRPGFAQGRPDQRPDGRPGFDPRRDDRRDWNDRRDDRRDWNRDWRNDRRYGWQDYRSSNRGIFRVPNYVGPRGYAYSYRRWSPGFRIDPWFYGSGYWINDPWDYRLPPAYGPYRWVRYYDDVILVDIQTGIVRDIIYDFFWR